MGYGALAPAYGGEVKNDDAKPSCLENLVCGSMYLV
jgi:hypothetical protein